MTAALTVTPTPDPVLVKVVLDESGSMASMAADLIGGFNTYLAELRASRKDFRVSLVKFDSVDPFNVVYRDVPVGTVPDLTPDTYRPRGGTPLWDAVGRTILETRAEPGQGVLVVIYTDGEENESREFTAERVRQLVLEREALGWTFVYLGASESAWQNENAFRGTRLAANVYRSTGGTGTRSAHEHLSAATIGYAGMGHSISALLVTDEDRAEVLRASG